MVPAAGWYHASAPAPAKTRIATTLPNCILVVDCLLEGLVGVGLTRLIEYSQLFFVVAAGAKVVVDDAKEL